MQLGLEGRGVVVLGAGSGLGRATALAYAAEGAVVTVFARDASRLEAVAEEIDLLGGERPTVVSGSITSADDLDRLMATAAARDGAIWSVFLNGGGPAAGRFEDFDDAAWQQAYEATLLGYIRATRSALPYLRASGSGRIVNNASSGVKAALDGLLLSNVFRLGIIGLTRTLSVELAGDGILVNAVAAGKIATDRVASLDRMRADRVGTTAGEVRAQAERTIPVGRYGTPEEFARTVVFHGSPANTYVTGQTLLVDGGMYRGY
ncbi:SDR family oxidoreductase [Dactylosporangium sucinum]|uniref:3-oxoacyl-ACP reductase n=1 Tax=Dactylosporangium sucinum TaxID=1424081 RepID=A0A917U9P6_9ACTN|nr:SDR family oxidoreductase [Dactylosporangium sucinum]GGM64778.1 3-oxoacyl-ACP reductase [Dactylosporangium sucinum]